MQSNARNTTGQTLFVLHPAFALTGVLQAIGGPLLPSLASTFHLKDSQSGLLFLLYFAGTSLGAFFCRGNYARSIALGFLAMTACCLGVAAASLPFLPPLFLLLGISVGVPMSGVSLFAGRNFGERCAPMLTFLNFSWSAGALAAPLLAAQILLQHTYRAAYFVLAVASAVASVGCWLLIRDVPESARPTSPAQGVPNLRLIVVFAIAAFLQVGVENTAATWLTTYSLRMARDGVVLAAASTSIYWVGFLASRGISSLVLLRADPVRVFRVAVTVALSAAVLLAGLDSVAGRAAAMFILGAALAPIFPLVVSGFFSRARHTSDSRWVLATAGFGGSVLPWLAGWISTRSGSLRVGILTIPAAMLLMVFVLPTMRGGQAAVAAK